ncbi:MAG TPA: adenylate/guanylate cyclase domain-containing protein [Spirochaetota bacterium]|nr:adenylate/guanylate cyclase domain-containing protein [Spirochaetota bacterium]
MNGILILSAKIALVLAILLGSAFTGKVIAKKLDKSIWLFFLIGLFTGPIGLLFLFLIFKLPEKLVGLFISFFVFLIITVLFTQTTILSGLEWGSIDFRFYLRDPSQASVKLEEGVRMNKINPRARKDIIIIGIDEGSIREFSDQGIQWPFPWEIHARVTRYLATGNPLAILYDIMFLDKKDGEMELAESLKQLKVGFLDYPFETKEVDVAYNDIDERIKLLNQVRFPIDPSDKLEQLVEEVTPPTPDLIKASKGLGFANVFPGRDGINRTVPLIVKYNGWYYPNIDLVIVMHYFGITQSDVEVKMGHYIKLKNLPAEKMARPNTSREISIPIDEYGFMDVNFIGGSGSFQHYPYYLFANEGTMEGNTSVKDKILLIAAYSATGIATDEKKSPYGATFGIEHHANALNTILNQDFLYKLTDFQNIIIMLVIAIFLGLIVPKLSIVMSLVVTSVFIISYAVGSYLLFDMSSIITSMSTPLIQTALTYSMLVTYRVVNEQQEKKYIRQTFSKFVSKSVVDELLRDPSKIKLGGDKKILTVLFSDIRGFTSISEKLTPEELVEHLNIYLQGMTDIVINTDGTLDKYIGDAIMAFWGAPIEMSDHSLKACRAALEMMEALKVMNHKWEKEGKPILDIGIGINTGDMVVGNMGSSSRMDYTLMGDNVNLGSRLEGTNKFYGTNIIISEFTYQYVKDDVIARELDLIRVKGKALPVKIYELIDLKQS